MNLPVYYSLVGLELGLVVGMGVLAAQKALRRQEIRHAALALEIVRPVPQIEFGAAIAIPADGVQEPVSEPVALQVVPDDEPKATERRSPVVEQWIAEAKDAAIAIANVKGDVTSDDVWAACPPPDGIDGRLMSRVLSRSDWEIVGYQRSIRGRNVARQIAVWRLKEVVQ